MSNEQVAMSNERKQSKLDELIQEHCPNGVEFKPLGSICEIRSGWGFPNKEQGKKQGDFPFFKVGDMNNSEMKCSCLQPIITLIKT